MFYPSFCILAGGLSVADARPVSLIAALLRGLQKLAFEIVQVCGEATKVGFSCHDNHLLFCVFSFRCFCCLKIDYASKFFI